MKAILLFRFCYVNVSNVSMTKDLEITNVDIFINFVVDKEIIKADSLAKQLLFQGIGV